MATKEQFAKYHKVQFSGVTNMFDIAAVGQLSGLDKPTILDIMKNYVAYAKQFTCKYNRRQIADRECWLCHSGLCSAGSCGYYDEKAKRYLCNECWPEYQEQYLGVCSHCGNDLAPIYENNGFTEPAGPSHWEITGYKLCPCQKEDN